MMYVRRTVTSAVCQCLIALLCFSSPLWAQEQPAEAQPPFDLMELRVLGNTVLDARVIERVLTPHLGPGRTLRNVEDARAELETAYHDQGFGTVFIDIPEQTIGSDGVVRLRVTEARLRQSKVTGARYFANRQIREALPEAARDNVPNLPQLQKQLTALNGVTPDRSVVPVLKAGPVPGTVDLDLQVQDKLPLHLVVEANDQYTADTTRLRSSVALSYNNAFDRQDIATLQYQASPMDWQEVQVLAASYAMRLGSSSTDRDRLTFTYINSSSQVATVGDITVAGKGKNYSARYSHPVANTQAFQANFNFGADYKDSAQDVLVTEGEGLSTPLSYASLQTGYSLVIRDEQRVWNASTSLAFGLSGFGSSRQEFADKCYRCKPNWSVIRLEAGVRQKLPWDLSLGLQAAGQYAVDPLISNEQKLIGGANSVRGYLEAETLGDIGVHGSIDLRAANLHPFGERFSLQPFVFLDAGVVRFQAPLPGQNRSSYLRSAGLGLDLDAWDFFTASLYVAHPLLAGNHTLKSQERFGFLLRTSW